jgi:hypothetical protein
LILLGVHLLLLAGFSVSRSFREAPQMADAIQAVLKEGLPVPQAAQRVWEKLWTTERRAQVREAGRLWVCET